MKIRFCDMFGALLFVGRSILVLFFLQSVVYGMPPPASDELPGNYYLTSWTTDNGLPQNSVNKIIQTRDGYIWLATNDGLVRFDGVKFTVFNSQNFPLLKTSRITDIYESKDGSLWIATEGGGVVVKRKKGPNTVYTTARDVPLDSAGDFYEDSKGRMWVNTGRGLYYFKDGRWFPFSTFTTKIGGSQNPVYKIFEDSRHNLWIVTTDDVLHRFHDGNISHIPPPPGTIEYEQNIHLIYEDRDRNVWFGYVNFLGCFKDGTFTRIPLENTYNIVSMAEDQRGNLWTVNMDNVFYLVKDGKLRPFHIPGVSNKKYNAKIMIDREGLLWMGNSTNGLSRLRWVPLASFTVGSNLSVYSLHQDTRGIVWIGTNGKEVYYYENGSIKPFKLVSLQFVAATLTDSKGYHWFGNWGDGLVRVKDDQIQTFTKADGLANNVVLALYEDSEKNLWIGTGEGLTVYKDGKFKNFHNTPGFKGNYVISLLKDSRGVLWAGTKVHGLNRLENGRFTNYSTEDGLSHNAVRSLYEDDTGSLWIGTYGGGLNRFKNGTFVTITTENGLYDNVVSCILEDDDGYFWMTCNRGIYRAAKQELNDFADGKIQAVHCIYYNKKDGMKTAECNGGFQPAGWKAADGKLWFPTIHGVVVVDPHQVVINPRPPPVIVEKMMVDGHEIDLQLKKELPPGVKRLEFHYTGLSFVVPERVRFRFKLEGLEEEWQDVGTRRVAYYNQIPPGNYTFRVKACNNDGIWNETGASVSFYQKPYFYQTGWFVALCVLAALFLIFIGYRLRVRQLKARTKELDRMVESRTRELAEQSEKLKELDKAKSLFFANISHEFRTPLTLIMGPLQQILGQNPGKDIKNKARLMLRNAHRLLNLINQLLELAQLDSGKMKLETSGQNIIPFLKHLVMCFESLAEQNNVDLIFNAKDDDISLYFDEEKLEKIITNLLSNAFKYTPAGGSITVTVQKAAGTGRFPSGYVEVSVRDTGTGIPENQLPHIFDRFHRVESSHEHKQKGSGIGLALTKELVELHHGEIEVKSSCRDDYSRGSEFLLRLPLGKEHLQPEEITGTDKPTAQRAIESFDQTFSKGGWHPQPISPPEGSPEASNETEEVEKPLILVVDDNADVRMYIKGALEPYFKVVEAGDGKEGILRAKEIIPDLIVSDVMMPGRDGYELCRLLKQDVRSCHIPVVLLTAKAGEESRIKGLELGADDYITKPFNTDILRVRIKNLIRLRSHLQKERNREMALLPAKIKESEMDREFVKELNAVIEKNLEDPEFNVEQLAKKLYMSSATVFRKIQAISGEVPSEYIRSFRLKRAAELLKGNFGSITEVAFEVGFNSRTYFTKCFKEKFHQLPSVYMAAD